MGFTLEETNRVMGIFFPYASEEIAKLMGFASIPTGRIVHYTSAENALKILKSKRIWLRNARMMSDWSEVQHGFRSLQNYFSNHGGGKEMQFHAALGGLRPNLGQDAFEEFSQRWNHNHLATYISSFATHHATDDLYGRLSMWRGFGRGVAGVALVFNPPAIGSAIPLNIFLHRVAYFDEKQLSDEIDTVLDRISKPENAQFLKEMFPDDLIVKMVYKWLMMTAVSLKHPGFQEEEEWRLIHSPTQFGSPYVEDETVTLDGIPQTVYKVPLINKPEVGINNISIPQLLDKVIIGPTPYSSAIYDSIFKELTELEVMDVANKIRVSDIPLR